MSTPSDARTAALPARAHHPPTARGEVVDELHGVRVADPYRWLEELGSAETTAWVAAQNEATRAHLATIPGRDALRRRLTELWDYPRVSVPFREAGRLFYRRNSGLERQSVLYERASLDAEPRVVLDPNRLSEDGSLALATASPSPDGRWLAVALSHGGSDMQTVGVRELATGRETGDVVEWVKFSGISWTRDGAGFFYSRFPTPQPGQELQTANRNQALYYHRVGTSQASDRLIYERPDLPEWFVYGGTSEDGRYLFVSVSQGATPRNRLYWADLGDPLRPDLSAPVLPLVESDDAEYTPVGNVGATVYLRTDLDAPRRRVVAVDLAAPAREHWRGVVPEGPHAIEDATMAGGCIVVHYLADVQSRLRVFAASGAPRGEVALPGVGTVLGLSARNDVPELFYAFTSPLYPTAVFRHDLERAVGAPFEPAALNFDPSRFETTQRFYASRDGTQVPMFVTHRRGMPLDGANPTLLYAYGGFSVSMTAFFSPAIVAWVEAGGVYAQPSLRGGGEYGEAWHEAGMLDRKQNVFDDFIAAAEYLIAEGYTSPAKLAIEGGSNGGLLVGVVMQQRPELFAVALPAVGVMDMLRYHRFTGGAAWTTEYGSADDPAAFAYLLRYSPLHNVKPGTCYPATLVTTADHDDRVVPSHSYKFTAAMQAAQGCDRPVLIRVETRGSHGYRPTDRLIDEQTDVLSFALHHLGVPVGAP